MRDRSVLRGGTNRRLRGVMAIALTVGVAGLQGCAGPRDIGAPGNPELVVLLFPGLGESLVREAASRDLLPNLEHLLTVGGGFHRIAMPGERVMGTALVPTLLTGRWQRKDEPRYSYRPGKRILGFPWRRPQAEVLGHGEAIWQTLDHHGEPAAVLRAPKSFPLKGLRRTVALAACDTPNGLGNEGVASRIQSASSTSASTASSRLRLVGATWERGRGRAELPLDTVLEYAEPSAKGPARPGGPPVSAGVLSLELSRAGDAGVLIRLPSGEEILAPTKEWTDWSVVRIPSPQGGEVRGLLSFFVLQSEPELDLLVSPLVFDPADPSLPWSTSQAGAQDVGKSLGPVGTIAPLWGCAEEGDATLASEDPQLIRPALLGLAQATKRFRSFTLQQIDLRRARLVVSAFPETAAVLALARAAGNGRSSDTDPVLQSIDEFLGEVVLHLAPGSRLVVIGTHAPPVEMLSTPRPTEVGFVLTSFAGIPAEISPLDLTPTLLALSKVAAPSGSEGRAWCRHPQWTGLAEVAPCS